MARFFGIFHALSFELNFFFDQRFPLSEALETFYRHQFYKI